MIVDCLLSIVDFSPWMIGLASEDAWPVLRLCFACVCLYLLVFSCTCLHLLIFALVFAFALARCSSFCFCCYDRLSFSNPDSLSHNFA